MVTVPDDGEPGTEQTGSMVELLDAFTSTWRGLEDAS